MDIGLAYVWLMVLLRSIGVILQLPIIAGRPIPIAARMAMSMGLAALLSGIVPTTSAPAGLWQLIAAAAFEIVMGLALGFVVRVSFAAVEMAGRLISTEIGLSAMPGFGAPDPAHEPVAGLVSVFAIVLFFLFGGHHGVLLAFAKSFQFAPAGAAAFDPSAGQLLIRITMQMFELGVRIAAPFIAMNFLVNLAFSVLGKAVPKTNVFIVSFSARALFGLALLATSGALVSRYLYVEFGGMPLRMLQLLRAG